MFIIFIQAHGKLHTRPDNLTSANVVISLITDSLCNAVFFFAQTVTTRFNLCNLSVLPAISSKSTDDLILRVSDFLTSLIATKFTFRWSLNSCKLLDCLHAQST